MDICLIVWTVRQRGREHAGQTTSGSSALICSHEYNSDMIISFPRPFAPLSAEEKVIILDECSIRLVQNC